MSDFEKHCADMVAKAAEGAMSLREAGRILRETQSAIKKLQAENNLDDVAGLIKADMEARIAKDKMDALVQKKNALINIVKDREFKSFSDKFKDKYEGLISYAVGSIKGGELSRKSVDYAMKTLLRTSRANVEKRLMALSPAHFENFINDSLQVEIATELGALNSVGVKPGVKTGNKMAFEIAQVLHQSRKEMVSRMNRAGANIRELDGYAGAQSHNPQLIRNAGWNWRDNKFKQPTEDAAFEKWRDFVVEKLDLNRTFGKSTIDADLNAELRKDWNSFVTGTHLKAKGFEESNGGFVGGSNLAKRASQSRSYHFKSAKDYIEYNNEFGTKSFSRSYWNSVDSAARNTALMEGFGTNPKAFFDKQVADLVDSAQKAGDIKTVEKFNKNKTYLENIFKNLDGTTMIPANVGVAKWVGIVKASQVMAKLGGMVPHSVTDIPMIASQLQRSGIDVGQKSLEIIKGVARGRGSEEMKKISGAYGMARAALVGEMTSRYTPYEFLPGAVSKAQHTFFKYTGQHFWDDAHETTVAWLMSHFLGDQHMKTFAELGAENPKLISTFKKYGIDEKKWDLYRELKWDTEDGLKVITPDRIREIPREKIEAELLSQSKNVTDDNVERFYDELEKTFTSYVVDQAEMAVPKPGAAEGAMLNWGFQPGTWQRSVLDLVMQFKSFPTTVVRKGLASRYYDENVTKFDMFKWMAATSMYGYAGYALTDLAQGKVPRSPMDPKVIMDSLAKGGGLGIYGDFLFGEYNKTGRSALGALAGPTLGQMDSVMDLYTRIKRGDDVGAQSLRMIKGNTPFANLFYTRLLADGLFWWNLQEMASPGSVKRMTEREVKENDRQFLINPTDVVQ